MNNRILLRLLLGFSKRRERHCGTTARVHLGTEQLEPRALLSATPSVELLVVEPIPRSVMPVTLPMQEAGYSTTTLSQANVAPILWGEGLSDPGQPSAWNLTDMPLGEFHSLLNFSKRDTIDPLLAPGNPNFWHAHDFFVNPSVSENSTLASLMQAGESGAAPTNNLSVYWVPSLMNTTTGDFVTPLDSSIAYYAVQKPLEPSKIVDMPAGLSIIAGSAMPSERQPTAVMFWNYIGTSTQYDHIPQGDEWQDLPLQAVIMFPQFWDGKSLAGTNFKDHMAYDRGGDGGPSSHPYLLPELQLQIHYGHVPEDASLILTSDSMTADQPDYAPGWSMHADFIHTPWPERDVEGNLYDGFARRVNDNLRWPTVAGTDGNAARPNPMGLQQPFTPAPLVLDPMLPGIDPQPVSDQPPEDIPRDVPAMGPHFPGTRPSRPLLPSRPLPVVQPRNPSLENLDDGQTVMIVGQTFQDEYIDFIDGTGLVPSGSSHYSTFYLGQIEQGDDSPNAEFLDYVRENDLGDYAMVALSFKDNTPAGGYGQMINQNASDYNSNAIWEALNDIRNGAWDAQIDSFSEIMADRPDTQFLLRVGYEVSLLLFAYNGDQYVVDWLDEQASAGVNVFENPDAFPELDRSAFVDAYNHIVDRIESRASNVEFGFHPVRGYNDTRWLYPGEENVDWVGFSVFNNDVGMEVNGTFNAEGLRLDPNLEQSMDFAQLQGHEIVIAEATAQNPAASDPDLFIDYLDRLDDVVQHYDVAALTYINSDWPAHGWGPEWGDSRVEMNPQVKAFFLDTFGDGTRYLYSSTTDGPIDRPDPTDDQPIAPQPESPAPAPVPDDSTPSPIDTPTNPVDALPQLAFSLDWPGPDIWMVVDRTNALFGYAENIAAISSMSATIQNLDTGLYLRRDGRFGVAESFDIEINRNNGHWSLLHTPVAGGTYRLVVTAASVDGTTQSQTTTFNVRGELSDPSVQDPVSPPQEDPIQSQPIFTVDFENSGAGIYTRDQLRADWNTPAWSQGVDEGRVSLVEQESGSTVLAVEYPAGEYGTRETGAQWKLNFDASYTSVELSYDVQFEEGFDFVKGGKLPGLFGGEGNTGGGIPTGMDGFSARMMWRGNGRVVQYVYYPDQPEHFGHDMPWTDPATGEDLMFTPGTWHNVVHQLKLNTPGERNGVLRTYFDGQLALEVQGLRFRDTTDFAIDGMYFSTFFGGGSDSWSTTADETIYFDNFRISEITFENQPQPVVPPEVAPEPVPSPNPTLPSVGAQPLPTTDVSLALAQAIADGRILASPAVGDAVPHRFDGTPLQPLTTSSFNQAVPSSDWWSSVVMPVFGDDFSAPLHAHPLTVQATSTGLLVGAPTETTVAVTGATTAEYKTPHRFDLQLELLQQDPASQFAVEEYGDWSFTGRWLGGDTQPTATLAQGSPVVWLDDVNFEQMVVVPTDGNADIEIGSNYAFVTVAGRTSLVLGPEGSRLEVLPEGIVVRGVPRGELAVGLLPESDEETRLRFLETAGNRLETTQFSWDTHSNPFDIRVRYEFGAEESSEVLLAAYPHLTRLAATPDSLGQAVGSSGYVSPRGELGLVSTTGFDIDVPARGVLPTLPAVLTGDQLNTLRDMVRNDPAAIDPAGTLNRYGDTYWAGKAMLKLSQLTQLAEITGQTDVRERILTALKNELSDWFTATGESGDKHFAYNAEWDTLQGYPDSFGSAGDLNDHHFHYGYFIHAAALVGSFDAEWAMNQKQMVDLLVADVAGTDVAGNMLPRLRSFSPMAGHSWASGHGAFASGNNHESSSESMNFATAVMLWGEMTGDTGMTGLGQMLYSVEAEAISEYWFNRYGTVFPESFQYESLGMVWGDGGSHATWFSAEPEMIKGINFLPFHGGSLYLAEMARDPTALLAEIEQLGGGVIDDWPGIILQYEALVNPEAAANRLALGGIGTEEGQTMAQTYFWTTVLSNIGTPTSVIRGDHPLSAVFQKEGVTTYVAHNAGKENITVLFNDNTSIEVPVGETVTRQRLESSDQLVDPIVVDQLPDQPVREPTLPSTPSLSLVSSTNTVRLLVDSTTGLAFVQESANEPLLIRRADDYFNGDVPLVRGTATLVAAARDDLGRIRVLDVSEWGAFAWILDENGMFQAEEGPTDSTLSSKEVLFQIDLDGDGVIGMSSTP